MSGGVPWSTHEDQRLRLLAKSGLGAKGIAHKMNRPQSVIRRHAEKLKIGIAGGRNVMATVGRLVDLRLKAKK